MTTLKKLVVIFTATGSQGFAITKHLATDPIARSRYTLRALTRDPSKPQAKELANLGVEVVECSLDSDESVSNAVSGAWAIFANSDFWSVFTVEAEVIQGRRMLAAASKLPNLEIFIQSSFPDARVVSNGKNQGVLHYNAKNEINAVSRTEYPSLWAKTTIIWVAYYYQNWLKFNYPFGPHKTTDSSGKVSYAQRMTYPPDTIIPSFFPGDLGPVIATILQGGGLYHGKTIACVAEKQTDSERLRIWADTLHVSARFEQVSREAYVARFSNAPEGTAPPPHIVQDLCEQVDMFEYGDYLSGEDIIQARDIIDPSYKLKAWEEYVQEEDWSSIL